MSMPDTALGKRLEAEALYRAAEHLREKALALVLAANEQELEEAYPAAAAEIKAMRSATMPRRALQDEARATWTAADQRDKEWGC
jgi:signal recognition particle receptor subunit beta